MDALTTAIRPHLQPITQNLPAPLREVVISILGDVCYKSLILDIDPTSARVLLLEGTDRILPTFVPKLSARAVRSLRRLGVAVRTDTVVRSLRFHIEGRIQFDTTVENIEFDTVLELTRGEYEVK